MRVPSGLGYPKANRAPQTNLIVELKKSSFRLHSERQSTTGSLRGSGTMVRRHPERKQSYGEEENIN